MSKLICSQDIEKVYQSGKTVCPIDPQTIITPSARDQAQKYNIEFRTVCPEKEAVANEEMMGFLEKNCIDEASFLKVLKVILESGLLKSVTANYKSQVADNGLKVVDGASVRMDSFDTGKVGTKVTFQELIHQSESKMSSGFLTIEDSSFDWHLDYEEIDYVIEGTLQITINGKTLTAKTGDVVFVPKGSQVVWSSPDKARIFYTTYPSDWASQS